MPISHVLFLPKRKDGPHQINRDLWESFVQDYTEHQLWLHNTFGRALITHSLQLPPFPMVLSLRESEPSSSTTSLRFVGHTGSC